MPSVVTARLAAWCGRTLTTLALAAAVVVLAAPPAGAHGVGGLQPSDYRTVLHGFSPPVPGLSAHMVNSGTKIELRNTSRVTVTVLGYAGEPYLRIGPGGVLENARSPAVFLNRSSIPTQTPPARFDAHAPPEWKRISTSPVARWHDHRSHWMGSGNPPAVDAHPGRPQVVIPNFSVPMRLLDGRAGKQDPAGGIVALRGDVVYAPGPSPFPWVAGALVVGALVVGLSRTAAWRWVLAAALAIVAGSETAHVVGAWTASTAPSVSRLGASGYSIAGIAVALAAAAMLARRDPWTAIPAVLVAGLFVAIAGGLTDITALSRSQIPTTLDPDVARALVVLALGVGTGLVVAAALRLRRPVPIGGPARGSRRGREIECHGAPPSRVAG